MNETTKYYVNYWYDNRDEKDPFKYVLVETIEKEGIVGEDIEEVEDYVDGFYFKVRDNLPITLNINSNKNIVNVYNSSAYREDIYRMSTNSLTDSVAYGDANIFFKLIACLYGDLYMQAKNIDDVINIDMVDEEHLRHLSKLVDYPWSEALPANRQRESVKFYMMLRRMRGTSFALTNLIRIFGQSAETLYQPTDNTGVRIIEYYENNPFGLFPGDIRVEIPELSKILRDAIDDVKLMGTRLVFAYRLPISSEYEDEYGVIRGYHPNIYWRGRLTYWLQPGMTGWDKEFNLDEVISEGFDKQLIYKYRDTYKLHGGLDLIQKETEPYVNLWMFQEYGLRNVRGVLLDDGVIQEDLFLYR